MAIVVAKPMPKRCLPARTKSPSLKSVDGAPGRAVTHPEEGPLSALSMCVTYSRDRYKCRKQQESRLPHSLPPRVTRNVGLEISFLPKKWQADRDCPGVYHRPWHSHERYVTRPQAKVANGVP